ncbi:hypothetical protein JXA63_05510 [Candidatus Woesebacteria bacterium]|nr:hypothetical protein [Candidatus Woesebacteria bacterium]
MSVEAINEQNIFSNGNPPEIGIGKHNVGSGVLRDSDRQIINKIDAMYGARLGHLPNATSRHIALIEKPHQSTTSKMHLEYLSTMYGVRIEQMTAKEVNELPGSKLVVPYIYTADVDRVNGPNTRKWGLPRALVDALKNKAQAHLDMRELQTHGILPVNFDVTNTDRLTTDTLPFITGVEQSYDYYGVANKYPVGVMIRPQGCDGGYGNAVVEQTQRGIAYTPDGNNERTEYYSSWKAALGAAEGHVRSSSKDANPEIVVSRFIDVEDSPGMTMFMIDGESHSLGWNGQLMSANGKACVGTTTFNPISPYSKRMKSEYEDRSAEALANHIHAVAEKHGVNLNGTRGLLNVDLMIPGEAERLYLERSGQNPNIIYVAEFNPRWTNGSDAAAAVVWATRREHTAREYMQTVRGGLLAVDKEKVPYRSSEERYDRALRINEDLREQGSGVILRMPGQDTIGVIYHGDTQEARRKFLREI